jgi:hypothetical protein
LNIQEKHTGKKLGKTLRKNTQEKHSGKTFRKNIHEHSKNIQENIMEKIFF